MGRSDIPGLWDDIGNDSRSMHRSAYPLQAPVQPSLERDVIVLADLLLRRTGHPASMLPIESERVQRAILGMGRDHERSWSPGPG